MNLTKFKIKPVLIYLLLVVALCASFATSAYAYTVFQENKSVRENLQNTKQELDVLKSEDQIKKNVALNAEIKDIHDSYSLSISVYEKLVDLKGKNPKVENLDTVYAQVVRFLADKNSASASAKLQELNKLIETENSKLATNNSASGQKVTASVVSNNLPGSGYSRQQVKTDSGTYVVDIIAADLNSTKVVVDSASDDDCKNDCPVMSVGEYASRSGAYAGINGNFFCPPEYPSCVGKTNSFDTLVMNKNKKYLNSDNNVYSNIPAAIFTSGGYRFVGRSLEWGRDTGVDAVIANYPLLVSGGNINFSENPNEPKFGQRGARTFVAGKGNMAYIGVVYGATMGESAQVMKALGVQEALNLDEGGSTALWFGGRYLAGPGRKVPTAVLFIKK